MEGGTGMQGYMDRPTCTHLVGTVLLETVAVIQFLYKVGLLAVGDNLSPFGRQLCHVLCCIASVHPCCVQRPAFGCDLPMEKHNIKSKTQE